MGQLRSRYVLKIFFEIPFLASRIAWGKKQVLSKWVGESQIRLFYLYTKDILSLLLYHNQETLLQEFYSHMYTPLLPVCTGK